MTRIKTYVLFLQKKFPAAHHRSGQLTDFSYYVFKGEKIHSLQGDYKLWSRRLREINAGKAVLSVREWKDKSNTGEPVELFSLSKEQLPGCQLLNITLFPDGNGETLLTEVDGKPLKCPLQQIAINEGLSLDDFKAWLKLSGKKSKSVEKVIIHFTPHRYT